VNTRFWRKNPRNLTWEFIENNSEGEKVVGYLTEEFITTGMVDPDNLHRFISNNFGVALPREAFRK